MLIEREQSMIANSDACERLSESEIPISASEFTEFGLKVIENSIQLTFLLTVDLSDSLIESHRRDDVVNANEDEETDD